MDTQSTISRSATDVQSFSSSLPQPLPKGGGGGVGGGGGNSSSIKMENLISYQKQKNDALFQSVTAHPQLALQSSQNYMPLYDRLFSFHSASAANQVQLKTVWNLHQIKHSKGGGRERGGGGRGGEDESESELTHSCVLQHSQQSGTGAKDDKFVQRKVFFKLAPLLDPYKYMTGKYGTDETQLLRLPAWGDAASAEASLAQLKMADPNNAAYVDGFFVHLSSQLLHRYGFAHGIDHYASFLSVKTQYKVNVYDDVADLAKNAFFNQHCGVWFQVEDFSHLLEPPTLPFLPADANATTAAAAAAAPARICLQVSEEEVDLVVEEVVEEEEKEKEEEGAGAETGAEVEDVRTTECSHFVPGDGDELEIASQCSTLSACSSRTSYTTIDPDMECEPSEEEGGEEEKSTGGSRVQSYPSSSSFAATGSEGGGSSRSRSSSNSGTDYTDDDDDDMEDDEKITATLSAFPVHVIAMEHCGTTLDELLDNYDLSEGEWMAMLMQIVMILLVYKKVFWMTHNDLHTNNIMFVPTNKTHIHYVYEGKTYRVPTYGRLFKIIDFGRAIYSFCGKRFCSDSYAFSGDGATQYNTEPYFDTQKPRVDPNFSFDLCRLACSLLDDVVDDPKHNRMDSPVLRIVSEWCYDDRGLNMLYKSNGEERYPGFKLYKMIARHVHKHTPEAQLKRPEFAKFAQEPAASAAGGKKKKGKHGNARTPDPIVISIDAMPSFA